MAFDGLDTSKIRNSNTERHKIKIRKEKYPELKELWEKINEKVVLEYRFDSEQDIGNLLHEFLNEKRGQFSIEGLKEKKSRIQIRGEQAEAMEETSILDSQITPVSVMRYSDFLRDLSKALSMNLKTVHQAIAASGIDINTFLSPTTIRIIRQQFNGYLMHKAFTKFNIAYREVSSTIHPTKFTNAKGALLEEVQASDIGLLNSSASVADNYFLEELFYDSDLEKQNIQQNLEEVTVFTKIPKNSIKIPVSGGATYSPDFAYVMRYKNGDKKLHFVVETKDVDGDEKLRDEEKIKIAHAKAFFGDQVQVHFRKQFRSQTIVDILTKLHSD
jgi:type III restriction enzyme